MLTSWIDAVSPGVERRNARTAISRARRAPREPDPAEPNPTGAHPGPPCLHRRPPYQRLSRTAVGAPPNWRWPASRLGRRRLRPRRARGPSRRLRSSCATCSRVDGRLPCTRVGSRRNRSGLPTTSIEARTSTERHGPTRAQLAPMDEGSDACERAGRGEHPRRQRGALPRCRTTAGGTWR